MFFNIFFAFFVPFMKSSIICLGRARGVADAARCILLCQLRGMSFRMWFLLRQLSAIFCRFLCKNCKIYFTNLHMSNNICTFALVIRIMREASLRKMLI